MEAPWCPLHSLPILTPCLLLHLHLLHRNLHLHLLQSPCQHLLHQHPYHLQLLYRTWIPSRPIPLQLPPCLLHLPQLHPPSHPPIPLVPPSHPLQHPHLLTPTEHPNPYPYPHLQTPTDNPLDLHLYLDLHPYPIPRTHGTQLLQHHLLEPPSSQRRMQRMIPLESFPPPHPFRRWEHRPPPMHSRLRLPHPRINSIRGKF